MREKFNLSLKHWKEDGSLAIAALLTSELLAVLWLGFLALFALETLLPTFVTVRLSLTEYLTWLILGTVATLWLRRESGVKSLMSSKKVGHVLLAGTVCMTVVLIALSMARFPLIPGLVFFASSLGLGWLLWRSFQEKS